MRLDEIEQGTAEQQRADRLKDNADAAKDRAKRLKAQADVSAAQAKMNKAQETARVNGEKNSRQLIGPK